MSHQSIKIEKFNKMSLQDLDVIIDILDNEVLFLSDLSHIPYVNRRMNKILDFKKELSSLQEDILVGMEESQNANR